MRLAALACASSVALAAASALAQEPAPVYQQQKQKPLRFAGDLLVKARVPPTSTTTREATKIWISPVSPIASASPPR